MEQLGTDFAATGSVMSRAELEDQRRKRGECVTCGRKCFQKKLFKMVPITDHGRVLNGRCLNCHPLDSADGAIPAVSRPATQEDLARFTRSQNNLRQPSQNNAGSPPPESRRAGGRSGRRTTMDHLPTRRDSNSRERVGNPRTGSRHSLATSVPPSPSGSQYEYVGGSDEFATGNSRRLSMGSSHGVRSSDTRTVSSVPRSMNSGSGGGSGRDLRRGRPGMAGRPNSSRSVSTSSYYSRSSRSGIDSQRSPSQHSSDRYADEDESGEYGLQNGHPSYEDDEFGEDWEDMGYGRVHTGADGQSSQEFAYYQRSTHDSSRSLHSQEPESYPRHGRLDRGGVVRSHHRKSDPLGSASNHSELSMESDHLRGHGRSRGNFAESTHSLDSVSSFEDEGQASGSRVLRRNAISSPELIDLNALDQLADSTDGLDYPGEPPTPKENYEEEPPEQRPQVSEDVVLERLQEAGSDYMEILNIMSQCPDSAEVQSTAMELISNLSLTAEDCARMANMGAIQVFINSMMEFEDDIELQICGCRAMWNVSGTRGNQLGFVEQGALDILVQDMEQFADDPDLQEQAMAVMANLGAVDVNLDVMMEKGVVERIVDAMNKLPDHGQVQVKGCLAIANLASHPTAQKEAILQQGGGSAIVISMVMHPNDPELQEKALRALRNLSANCDQNRIELTNIGGIDAIVSAMQVHRDDPSVQEAGAWTLSNLASNVDSKLLVGDCGGIDVIIRAMWVHSDKVSVQEWCCRALYTLSLDQQNAKLILEVGGISAVVNAMQAHVNSSSVVQEMGCAVLYNLAFNQQSKMRIVNEEALDAIVLAMVLFADDDKVLEQACQLLLQLCIAENFKAMQASNVGELVRAAAEKFPDTCGEPAERLIHVIEGYISEYR